MKPSTFTLTVVASLLLASCGTYSPTGPSPATYTVGGTVTNLVGTGGGLQLEDNGGDSLLVSGNGTFIFPTALASGSAYIVAVSVQPSAPVQTCEVTNHAGTATANITSVAVDCGHKEWTWTNGANLVNQEGVYGTQRVAATGNVPGARASATSWTDAAGNFWLFGGQGYDSEGTFGDLNDLWKYAAGQWTWMGGPDIANQEGAYGIQGTAAADNIPGARAGAITWTDAAGNFWLFGGSGYDPTTPRKFIFFNDLWKYGAGQWTWMGGSNLINQNGTYGAEGTSAPSNVPGARSAATSWTDAAGNFWLFGGIGYDSTVTLQGFSFLNDLWKYSAGQWTWMGGSNIVDQNGIYGTLGTAGAANIPGARDGAVGWTDVTGDFWLFGGQGYDSAGPPLEPPVGALNDFWKYSAGQWTWMGGSNLINQKGTYGTQGTGATNNVPGARSGATSSSDAVGNFWLFGGIGYDFTGTFADLNELWKYGAGEWTWMGGSNNRKGTYGTQNMATPGNIPGERPGAISWTDASGNFWLFGGIGFDSSGTGGLLNDLWKYEP